MAGAMSTKRKIFQKRAEECLRKAEETHEPVLKDLFMQLAAEWQELAAAQADLEGDTQDTRH
jgi:hypothetical protein